MLWRKIFRWTIVAILILGAFFAFNKCFPEIAIPEWVKWLASILLSSLVEILIDCNKKVDYSKVNITETVPRTAAKEILSQLSAEEIEKQKKVTQQEARAILGAMNEWQVGEIRSMYLYVKKHNYDPSMPLSLYKSTNIAEYEVLKDKLIQCNAVKHLGDILLDFNSLGYSICELVANPQK